LHTINKTQKTLVYLGGL